MSYRSNYFTLITKMRDLKKDTWKKYLIWTRKYMYENTGNFLWIIFVLFQYFTKKDERKTVLCLKEKYV